MERILKAFKDLYVGEKPFKAHAAWMLLMLIPALIGGFGAWLDKETPKETLVFLLPIIILLLCVAIVPAFMLAGFGIEFYRLRLEGKTGIPKITFDLFNKGLQVFPLGFVWCFYYFLAMVLFLFLPIGALVGAGIASNGDTATVILLILLGIVLGTVYFVGVMVLSPFLNYVFIQFSKDYTNKAEYFNPFVIFIYMKQAFKSTMLVMLKMILASFAVNMAAQMVSMIFVVLALAFSAIAAVSAPTEAAAETAAMSPIVVLLALPFTTIASLIQTYATAVATCAASDMYVEVYKNEIEPMQNRF